MSIVLLKLFNSKTISMKRLILITLLITFFGFSAVHCQSLKRGVASDVSVYGQTSINNPSISIVNDNSFTISYTKGSPSIINYTQQNAYERSYNTSMNSNYPAAQVVNGTAVPASGPSAYSRVAKNPLNGTYIVVYDEENTSIVTALNHFSIYIQKYNQNGTKNGIPIFVDYGTHPDVDIASDGTFNIIYQGLTNPSSEAVFAKRYNSLFVQVGPRISVAPGNLGMPRNHSIKSLDNNAFVASWHNSTTTQTSTIRRYNSNGIQTGSDILVTNDPQNIVKFIVKPNGNLVVLTRDLIPPSNYTFKILYFLNGSTNPTTITTYWSGITSHLSYWAIGSNFQGNYVICYPSISNGLLGNQVVQEFDINDVKVGPEYQITSDGFKSNYKFHRHPDISVTKCKYAVTWMENDLNNQSRVGFEVFKLQGGSKAIADAGPDKIVINGCATCSTAVIGSPALPGYSYSWSPTSYMTGSSTSSPTITHPGGGASFSVVYTVTASHPDLCYSSSDQVVVGFVSTRMAGDSPSENSASNWDVSIYPNPSNGTFELVCDFEIRYGIVQVFNSQGSNIFESKINNDSKMEIKLPDVPSGIYFVKVSDGNQVFSKKIVIEQ